MFKSRTTFSIELKSLVVKEVLKAGHCVIMHIRNLEEIILLKARKSTRVCERDIPTRNNLQKMEKSWFFNHKTIFCGVGFHQHLWTGWLSDYGCIAL